MVKNEETKTIEHILVCLSSSPSNPKVIKAGSEMAHKDNCLFTALYIETDKVLSNENQKRLEDNLILAKSLGAKIVTLNGNNIPFQVANYARTYKVTKLVIGRSGTKQTKFFNKPSFIDNIIALVPELEVFIIPDKVQKLYIKDTNKNVEIQKFTLKDTLTTIGVLAFATILGSMFHHFEIYDANIVLVYILAILFIAYRTKNTFYSIISSVIGVFLYNFFFVEPYFSTLFNNKNYSITFVTMFIVALIASNIAKKIQYQAHEAFLKTYRTEHLFDLSQRLQNCFNEKDIQNTLLEQLQSLFECDITLFTEKTNDIIISNLFDKFQNQNEVKKTETSLYFQVKNNEKIFGVIKIDKKHISKFEQNLIFAMIRETVLAIEKNITREINNALLEKNRQEELRTTLLRTISHDLRTPLTGISGYAELLIKNSNKINDDKKMSIYNDIYEDSIWLLNLVENLLSITRFEKDKIEIKQEIEFLPDIINEVITHLGRKKEKFNIKTEFSDDDLYAKMDGRLIAQVIFNLVDNATKYSDEHTTITIKAEKVNEDIKISVIDNGYGISDENKAKIFNLFYRVNNSVSDSRRGLGLGLALCKTVIEAHSSKIEIQDNKPQGTIISFKLKGYEDE